MCYLFPWGSIIPVIQYPAPTLTGVTILGQNVLQFSFTNSQSLSFTVLSSTNLGLPLGDWTVAGTATNVGAGICPVYVGGDAGGFAAVLCAAQSVEKEG